VVQAHQLKRNKYAARGESNPTIALPPAEDIRIIKNDDTFEYLGVTHEYVSTPPGNHNVNIKKDELFIRDVGDGGSKSDKFERDIRLLLEGIIDEPNNVRYHFYLANSYKDSGHFEKAIEFYKKRIAMGDWEQEIWYSNYNIANIYEHLGKMGDAV
jgi:tetratricopeptide (TPR) repeat protein